MFLFYPLTPLEPSILQSTYTKGTFKNKKQRQQREKEKNRNGSNRVRHKFTLGVKSLINQELVCELSGPWALPPSYMRGYVRSPYVA